MKKVVRQKRWYILLVAGAAVFFVGSMLQTPWLSTKLLRRALAARPGVIVKTVFIKGQHFTLPGRFHFETVKIALQENGKEFVVEAASVDVSGVQQWFGSDRRFLVNMEKARLMYDMGVVRDVRAQLTVTPQGVSGPVGGSACDWDKWQASDISAFMIVNGSGVEMRALQFKAYDGRLTGKVMVRTRGDSGVTYAGEIFAEGFNVARLDEINPSMAAQLDGVVTGTVSVEGDVKTLRVLDASLMMPAGGNINAALLAALTQYLPASREKERLDALINTGGKLGMELFSFTVKGGDHGKFSGELHLRSRAINLELNLTHEVNTDGTIASLLAYGQKFVQ